MKRLLSATLALSLLGGSAAIAAPYDGGDHDNNGGYGHQDRGYYHRDGNGAAVFAGVGLATLAIILASQHRHHRDGWYDRDGYRYRDGNGYSRDYDRGYDGHRDGDGDHR